MNAVDTTGHRRGSVFPIAAAGGRRRSPMALALAVSLAPVAANAGGFWEVARLDEPAPGVSNAPSPELVALRAEQERQARPDELTIVGLPGIDNRFGLGVRQKDGRPSFDGLAYQATSSLRISADGEYDFDEGSVSGGVKFEYRF